MTTIEPATAPRSAREHYRILWRALPRELGFHALTFPLAVIGFTLAIGLFSTGIGTVVAFFIGVFFLIAALYVARAFGSVELVRLSWAGRPAIAAPVWNAEPGFWGWLRSMVTNGHYWLYLLHTAVIGFVISTLSWSIMIGWVAGAIGGLTHWFWTAVFGPEVQSKWLFEALIHRIGWADSGPGGVVLEELFTLATGVLFALTLPLVSRGLILVHEAVARALLGAFPSDALRRQVGDLTESRGAAIATEGHSLRRLERDIHDGPQQRLVRLQMDLAAADRQLDSDPAKTRALIAEAMVQSREALDELRALSRGFAPPLLLDRGLVAALESAADRSPVPVVLDTHIDGITLGSDLERNVYFVVSEALANVAKHATATEVTVRLSTVTGAETRVELEVGIYDNGRGGALVTAGHGLAGLTERVRGLGGALTVTSPVGGPTAVLARIPVPVPVPVRESTDPAA